MAGVFRQHCGTFHKTASCARGSEQRIPSVQALYGYILLSGITDLTLFLVRLPFELSLYKFACLFYATLSIFYTSLYLFYIACIFFTQNLFQKRHNLCFFLHSPVRTFIFAWLFYLVLFTTDLHTKKQQHLSTLLLIKEILQMSSVSGQLKFILSLLPHHWTATPPAGW